MRTEDIEKTIIRKMDGVFSPVKLKQAASAIETAIAEAMKPGPAAKRASESGTVEPTEGLFGSINSIKQGLARSVRKLPGTAGSLNRGIASDKARSIVKNCYAEFNNGRILFGIGISSGSRADSETSSNKEKSFIGRLKVIILKTVINALIPQSMTNKRR